MSRNFTNFSNLAASTWVSIVFWNIISVLNFSRARKKFKNTFWKKKYFENSGKFSEIQTKHMSLTRLKRYVTVRVTMITSVIFHLWFCLQVSQTRSSLGILISCRFLAFLNLLSLSHHPHSLSLHHFSLALNEWDAHRGQIFSHFRCTSDENQIQNEKIVISHILTGQTGIIIKTYSRVGFCGTSYKL